MKKLLWLPGFVIIAIMYFLPTEWGKQRNVTRGGRWWAYKDNIAPVISILIYILIGMFIFGSFSSHLDDKKDVTKNSIEITPSESNDKPFEVESESKQTFVKIDSESLDEVVLQPQPLVNEIMHKGSSSLNLKEKISSKNSVSEVYPPIETQEQSQSITEGSFTPSQDKPINSIENRHYIPGH